MLLPQVGVLLGPHPHPPDSLQEYVSVVVTVVELSDEGPVLDELEE